MMTTGAVFLADRFEHLALLLDVLYCVQFAPKHRS
jgi:hypothetical protein